MTWTAVVPLLVLAGGVASAAQTLESAALHVSIASSGDVTIRDKRTGVVWRQVPPSEEAGWPKGGPIVGGPMPVRRFDPDRLPQITSVEVAGRSIRLRAKWRIPLEIRWSLTGPDEVQVDIDSLDKTTPWEGPWEGPMLAYPPPCYASGHADFAVVCEDEGALYPTAETDPEADHIRFLQKRLDINVSMPWWGVVGSDFETGMMTLVDTSFAAASKMVLCDTPDGKRALPTVLWLRSRGSFGYPRRLLLHFPAAGGYVAMAKRFRRRLVETGEFSTLAEKAKRVPAVAKLRGALDLWVFKPKEPLEVADIERIHDCGFGRLLLQVFSSCQPKPEEAFTPAALRKAHEYGYLTGQYHLYSWVYEPRYRNDPELRKQCIRGPGGYEPRHSAMWGDHLLYCPGVLNGILGSIADEERAYGLDSLFTDTTTAGGSVRDCHDVDHPLTRETATSAIRAALDAVSTRNMIVGSERGFWWAAKSVHFFEGVETLISYFHHFTGPTVPLHHAGPFRKDLAGYDRYMVGHNYGLQNRVPLFQLVFHDSVVCMRRWNDHHPRDEDLWRIIDLISLCYGTPPIICFHHRAGPHILHDDYAPYRERFLRTYRDVCSWHQEVGFEEMTGHRFLSPDRRVQETRFGAEHCIVVNIGADEWRDPRGFVVPPREYHLVRR